MVSKKDLFWTNEERVKLYFFRVPLSPNFNVKINVDALTEDFYPTVYLFKNNMTAKPADFRTLQYPTVRNYSMVLGDNFSQLANQKKVRFQNVNFCFRCNSFSVQIQRPTSLTIPWHSMTTRTV